MKKLTDQVGLLGDGFCNFYVVGGKEAALVECGTSAGAVIFAKQWAEVEDKPDIKYIVMLHSHFDHMCGISQLKKLFPEAQVVGSQVAQKLMSKERIVKMMFDYDVVVTESYLREGLIDEKPEAFQGETVEIDLVVGEGDSLRLGDGLQLKFLDAPGHSACSMAAYVEEEQVMLISDAAGFRSDTGQMSPVFFQDYGLYMNTIQKLMSYPTRIAGVAHGDVPEGAAVGTFYQQSLEAAEQAYEIVKNSLEKGIDEKALAEEMFNRYIEAPLSYYPSDMMLVSMQLLIENVKKTL
ncbi:MAG: MBL fold metallo-hydrolase [Bacillota bacterium]|nr:MBL fold metallo-hydrolase [Bacillota bacterium]